MSTTALGLVLLAAVFHALWNLAAKNARGDPLVFVWCYEVASAVVRLPPAVVQFARAGIPWSWPLLVGPLVAGILHIGYAMVLQTGYRRAALGVVYPVARGVGPLITMLVAVVVLGERPGTSAVVGGLLVLAGILVVATGSRGPDPTGRGGAGRLGPGVGYGVVTGLAIAAYTLWDAHAVTVWGLPPVTYFALGVLAQVVLLTPAALRRREQLRPALAQDRREIAIVGVLSPAAYVLVLTALRTTPVAVVAPVRESSIVIGSLLAWWWFHEPHPVRRLTGAAVVLAGIALIAVG